MSNGKFDFTGILDQTTQSVIVLFLGVGILWCACMTMPESVLDSTIVVSGCWQRRVLAQ